MHFFKYNRKKLENFLNKRRVRSNTNTEFVKKIIKDIKINKKKALLKYEKKYSKNDKIIPKNSEINSAIKSLDRDLKKAIDSAYTRIMKFHKLQKTKNIKLIDSNKNKIEYVNVPIQSVGIYVPGNLPSTLLMNAIPAKIAGVKRVVLASPRMQGKLNPAVMYIANKCGIKEIITSGGAQAIASLAYIQNVDKIIGPGNDYVARAKKEVFGDVGVEGMVAGPSEVTILADRYTKINQLATSMIAQSEHGINSQSILITKNKTIIEKTKISIFTILKTLPRNKIIKKCLKKNGLILLVKTDKELIDAINQIAPEHLEILTKNPKKYLKNITNAGSIGIGKYSPVAASDYNVGTNHTLGTLGSAKFASGLNLSDFYKKISQFTLTKKGIEVIGKQAITLANYENLHGHSLSVKSRITG